MSTGWLDHGDAAWQLTAATLVGMQSVPGLALLYGGVVKKKWAVNSAFMVLYAFAAVLICWGVWAYKMAFGDQWFFASGIPGPALDANYLTGQAYLPAIGLSLTFPQATLVFFQFVFASITLILIGGAVLGRMTYLSWMLFVPLWLTLSYCVGAFSIWGGGFLFKWGVLDFAGGYVIHLSSGVAGFTAAYFVGPRLAADREKFPPNNILLTLGGAGLLWLGWNGFNGGAPYAANASAAIAVLNTNLCTAMSMLTWTLWDIVFFKRPSVIGAVQGMITGLVGITPAAGFVEGWAALVIGLVVGTIPWFTMMVLGKRWSLLKKVDDTLGLLHTHGVAGLIGGVMVGLLATPDLCTLFGAAPGAMGAFYGNWVQLGKQVAAAAFIILWNILITSIISLVVGLVTPLRMDQAHLEKGDELAHGEDAYALFDERQDLGKSGRWYGKPLVQGVEARDPDEPGSHGSGGLVDDIEVSGNKD